MTVQHCDVDHARADGHRQTPPITVPDGPDGATTETRDHRCAALNSRFGVLLKRARLRAGMTLTAAVAELGTPWTVSRLASYERGMRNVQVETAAELGRLYQVDLGALIDETLARDPAPPTTVRIDLRKARQLLPDSPLGRFALHVDGLEITLRQSQMAALAALHGVRVDEFAGILHTVESRSSRRAALL